MAVCGGDSWGPKAHHDGWGSQSHNGKGKAKMEENCYNNVQAKKGKLLKSLTNSKYIHEEFWKTAESDSSTVNGIE